MSGGLYGHRSNSSASSSPPATSQSGQTGLVVPQPINAAKGGGGGGPGHPGGQGASGNNNHTGGHIHSHPSNGSSGRKYQCKMCPQVGKVGPSNFNQVQNGFHKYIKSLGGISPQFLREVTVFTATCFPYLKL